MQKISRQQARFISEYKYYTGVLCKKGHDSERYTNTGACVICIAGHGKKKKPKPKALLVRVYLDNPVDKTAVLDFVSALNQARQLDSI